MRLQVKGRHIDVTDSLFQYAERSSGSSRGTSPMRAGARSN